MTVFVLVTVKGQTVKGEPKLVEEGEQVIVDGEESVAAVYLDGIRGQGDRVCLLVELFRVPVVVVVVVVEVVLVYRGARDYYLGGGRQQT